MIRKEYDEHVRRMLDELAEHMAAADERRKGTDAPAGTNETAADESNACTWSMPVVVTYEPPATRAWVVPAAQDWVHDALYGAVIIGGTLYAASEPFRPGASELTGFFQASDTGLWLEVAGGCCELDAGGELAWHRSLEEFPQVASELASLDDQAWSLYAAQLRAELEEK